MALTGDIFQYKMHAKQAAFHGLRERTRVLTGGNRCVTKDTLIDTLGEKKTAGELFALGEPFGVWAWDVCKEERVPALASAPFKKPGLSPCYRLTMENGAWVEVADSHMILTRTGWRYIDQILTMYNTPLTAALLNKDLIFAGDSKVFSWESIGEQEVYDFTVADHHNYTAGGLIHHNSGKTVCGAADIVWLAMGLHPVWSAKFPPPIHIWIVSEDHKVSTLVAEAAVRQLLPKAMIKHWDWQLRILTLQDGTSIGFKSCDSGAEKFAGESKHVIWYDEPPDEAVREECTMRLLDTKGLEIFTMTPVKGKACWTYEAFQIKAENDEIPFDPTTGEKDFAVLEVSSYDNPHVDPEEIDRKRRELGEEKAKTRIFGKYTTPAGLIYPEFDPKVHVVPHERLPRVQSGWPLVWAMDHGASKKTKRGHSCSLLAALRPDGILQVFAEYYMQQAKPAEYHAMALKRMIPEWLNRPVLHLDRTASQFKIELTQHGLQVMDANNDHEQGFSRVRSYLTPDASGRPGVVFSSNCRQTIKDFGRYLWESNNFWDHSMDTLRYLCQASPRRNVVARSLRNMSLEEQEKAYIDTLFKSHESKKPQDWEHGQDGMGA